jgi:CheY-like chemotaxis protein
MASQDSKESASRPLRFLILEDNWQHAELLSGWLHRQFPGVEIRIVETAKRFQHGLDEFVRFSPDVIILDMMVRFTDPDDPDPATGSEQEDFFTAGARCYEQLRTLKLESRVIIYSVIDEGDLRKNNFTELVELHVQKEGEDRSALLDAIRRTLSIARK